MQNLWHSAVVFLLFIFCPAEGRVYAPWTRLNARPLLIRPVNRPPFIIAALWRFCSNAHCMLLKIIAVSVTICSLPRLGLPNCSVLKHQKLTANNAQQLPLPVVERKKKTRMYEKIEENFDIFVRRK